MPGPSSVWPWHHTPAANRRCQKRHLFTPSLRVNVQNKTCRFVCTFHLAPPWESLTGNYWGEFPVSVSSSEISLSTCIYLRCFGMKKLSCIKQNPRNPTMVYYLNSCCGKKLLINWLFFFKEGMLACPRFNLCNIQGPLWWNSAILIHHLDVKCLHVSSETFRHRQQATWWVSTPGPIFPSTCLQMRLQHFESLQFPPGMTRCWPLRLWTMMDNPKPNACHALASSVSFLYRALRLYL